MRHEDGELTVGRTRNEFLRGGSSMGRGLQVDLSPEEVATRRGADCRAQGERPGWLCGRPKPGPCTQWAGQLGHHRLPCPVGFPRSLPTCVDGSHVMISNVIYFLTVK